MRAGDEGVAMRRATLVVLIRCLAILSLLLLGSCSGCSDAAKTLDKAKSEEAADDFVAAASSYEKVCTFDANSDYCATARRLLPPVQIKAARKLIEDEKYGDAKTMLEKASASKTSVTTEADHLLKSADLIDGLRYENALAMNAKDAISTMEELASRSSKASIHARTWLEQKAPTLLLQLAKVSCGMKPPADDCGSISAKIVQRYSKSKEFKEADALAKAFGRTPFDAAQALEWQGKLNDAALRYDEVCTRVPGTELCKTAQQRADGARLRLAATAMASLDFQEAKRLYELVAKSSIEWTRKQASQQLDSAELKTGLALASARSKSKRDGLAEMEEVAKASTPAGWAARGWIAKERPILYLDDAKASCVVSADDCPTKCKQLLTAHPGTQEALSVRKLLTDWESEPIVKAEGLVRTGDLLAAASEYERTCARAPESSACARATPLVVDTRIRGAQDAIGRGHYADAKKALEASILATKDETKKATARRLMETPEFAIGLGKEAQRAALAAATTSCTDARPDCKSLVEIYSRGEGTDQAEVQRLLAMFEEVRRSSDAALVSADRLVAQCRVLERAEGLVESCFPKGFESNANGQPAAFSPVDRLALGVSYASGANGTPTAGLALRGLAVIGALLGSLIGVGVQLMRRRQLAVAVVVVVSGVGFLAAVLAGTGSFARTTAEYGRVGLDDR